MRSIEYTIHDENGIHARPAGIIVSTAKKYNSVITIQIPESGKSADAKKLFSVMGMGVTGGDTLLITADGEDEAEALLKLETEMRSAGL
ncbi:MAG: HPr family phosphocarrier protein [Ruminococcaceae bacterium]|nr:HPr family phosphocarrier protein [Oscillospiraceae bacterium]